MSRVNVNETLKSGTRGSTSDPTQHRFRHVLIVGQFALALTLLAGAGFFIRGLRLFLGQDLGWNTHGMIQCIINLPQTRYSSPEQTYSFYTRLEDRLDQLPGVKGTAIGFTLPVFQYLTSRSVVVEGREPPAPGHEPVAFLNGVTPSYLGTLGIKLVSGRGFARTDTVHSTPVAIINESMARALFPHDNPIGRRVGNIDPKDREWVEIVGVMPDFRLAAGFAPQTTQYLIFVPLSQLTWNYVTIAVRSDRPEDLAAPFRHAVEELDPNIPLQQLTTVDNYVAVGTGGMEMRLRRDRAARRHANLGDRRAAGPGGAAGRRALADVRLRPAPCSLGGGRGALRGLWRLQADLVNRARDARGEHPHDAGRPRHPRVGGRHRLLSARPPGDEDRPGCGPSRGVRPVGTSRRMRWVGS
jgi:hypothetical protein